MAEVKGNIVSVAAAGGKITKVVYESTNGKQCTYENGAYS